jgi:hypothetical protein
MSDQATDVARRALLFVPDISGFTQFVQTTEIEHSRHIIEELLEKLIEANTIGLEISEVEGDAIFFYRFGRPPTAEEFLQQVRKMFIDFHTQLQLYERQRICQCGACSSAQNLTVKFVAHFGDVSRSRIKDHVKLFGQDVITVHRLLKNNIAHREYALFTQVLMNEWPRGIPTVWAEKEEGFQEYDVGRIAYGHVPLQPLRHHVPEPRAEDFSIPGVQVPVFSSEHEIHAPLDLVFAVACDLPKRLNWMEGAKEVQLLNHDLNRLGTKHRCVVDKNSPVMVTSGSSRNGDTITLAETDEKKTMCSVYTLHREADGHTHVRIDGFVKKNVMLRIVFALLLKKKIAAWFKVSGENLKNYCEELYDAQRR